MIRPADLLVAEFELVNLHVRPAGDGKPSEIVRRDAEGEAFLILHLPPQNIAEQAFWETAPKYTVEPRPGRPADPSSDETPVDPPVLSRIAGTSRIAFRVSAGFRAIPYTIDGLLEACGELELSVVGTALPPRPPGLDVVPDLFGAPRWVREVQVFAEAVGDGGAGPPSGGKTPTIRTVMHAARSLRWSEGAAVEMRMATPATGARLSAAISAPIDLGRVRLTPQVAEPGPTQTAIEAPYRLIVSPSGANGWAHRNDAAAAGSGRVELWHTRLGTRSDATVVEGPHYLRKLRAVWARSGLARDAEAKRIGEPTAEKPAHYDADNHPFDPFRTSLDAADRWELVHLTTNYALTKSPEPVDVDNFMLSSMGAWIDTRGRWDLELLKYPEDWKQPQLEVEEWKHRGTMGRDHYVRVVYAGYLFPFGHRASLVKVTERKFHPERDGNPAYLRQRMFIVVRRPLKEYVATGLQVDDAAPLASGARLLDRQLPFSSVRVTTLVTPNLDPPDPGQSLFWPCVGGSDFRFHLVAVDLEGNTIEFTAPLAFTGTSVYQETETLKTFRDKYEDKPARSRVGMSGQKIAYAESERSGDTSFESDTVTFGAEVPGGTRLGEHEPGYYPCIRRAESRVPAVKQFTGQDSPAVFSYAGPFLREAAEGGFGGSNVGEVFFEVADNLTLPLDFSSAGDRAGGLLQPNLGVKGLSRLLGPVSGAATLEKIAAGTFEPGDFFSHLEAKLFGVLNLADIVKVAGVDKALDAVPKFISEQFTAAEAFLAELQKIRRQLEDLKARAGAEAAKVQAEIDRLQADFDRLTSGIQQVIAGAESVDLEDALRKLVEHLPQTQEVLRALPPEVASVRDRVLATIDRFAATIADAKAYVTRLLEVLRLPDELKMRFEWKPELKSWPEKPIFVAERNGKPASLVVAAEISAKSKLNPDPQIDIVCRLENFSLDLIGNVESFIKLHFDKIEFLSTGGSKSDVNVEFAGIEFVGPLSFVEALRDFIPLDGFSDPPALTVSERGIESSFSLPLPDIAVGVFSLQNLSLGAGFKVPFVGDPLSVRFQFCDRESPFLLTVSAFGGGGFFGIELDPKGVKLLEASFEFGASLSVDFGVASGGVYVMAGIYFKIQDGAVELTGYLRMGGNVEVLGIVSVSIELMMSLTYEEATGKCVGRATLSIEIEIAFFSTTVEISCERKFAGSNGDPTFAQLMAPEDDYDPWSEYCEAFA
ncbi:MAG: hypothetical protein ABR613_03695 [Actinomycetota bacterium]